MKKMEKYKEILISKKNEVVTITLNRPKFNEYIYIYNRIII